MKSYQDLLNCDVKSYYKKLEKERLKLQSKKFYNFTYLDIHYKKSIANSSRFDVSTLDDNIVTKIKNYDIDEVYIYCRVSTPKQLNGFSMEGQIDNCLKMARTLGLKPVGAFFDACSGQLIEHGRPGLNSLFETQTSSGFIHRGIVFNYWDRFVRSPFAQQHIRLAMELSDIVCAFSVDELIEGNLDNLIGKVSLG